MILGAIWEEDFADGGIGYRPGRGARKAIAALREELDGGTYRWVVEADVRGYFEHIDHGWLVGMLEQRIADGSVVCFEREDDAKRYLRQLRGRLAKFNLQLADERSALVKFNRWEPSASGKLAFLGFDLYRGRTRRNPKHTVVRLRTKAKKFRAGLLALKEWMKQARSQRLPALLDTLRHKLQGCWNYFAVPGNSRMTPRYNRHAARLLYKWLNRRSQRRSVGWREFLAKLPAWKLPAPRIRPVEPQMQLRPQANHA